MPNCSPLVLEDSLCLVHRRENFQIPGAVISSYSQSLTHVVSYCKVTCTGPLTQQCSLQTSSGSLHLAKDHHLRTRGKVSVVALKVLTRFGPSLRLTTAEGSLGQWKSEQQKVPHAGAPNRVCLEGTRQQYIL